MDNRSSSPLRRRIDWLALVVVVCGAWGFAVGRYEVFPYPVLQPVYAELRAFVRGAEGESKTLLQRLRMHQQVRPRQESVAFSDLSGFHRIDSGFVDPGYLLLARFSEEHRKGVAELVRLSDFTVLHRWTAPVDEILARSAVIAPDPPAVSLLHPLLFEDGSLVFGTGVGPLVRVDRDGNILWLIDRPFHHSIERDRAGNIVAVVRLTDSAMVHSVPFQDDGYAVISPAGRVLAEVSIVDILVDSGHEALLFGVGPFELDRIHLNDAQPIHDDRREARAGDVALSLRNVSTVLLYRPATEEVVWLRTGPWTNQHDVNLLESGGYSVLGNDVVRSDPDFLALGDISDVYVYDPAGDRATRPYTERLRSIGGLTLAAGRARVLGNDDLFLELYGAGQLFRVGREGVRWVYVNGFGSDAVGAVSWSRYYRADELDLGWLTGPPAGGPTPSGTP